MSSSSFTREEGAVSLGGLGNVASWRRPSKPVFDQGRGPDRAVCLVGAGGFEDGIFVPASSFYVCGTTALKALRAAVDEALKGVEP
jgi:hypothetical protein